MLLLSLQASSLNWKTVICRCSITAQKKRIRTGVFSAILLRVLGVPMETIVAD
jgi:hypothetical protein